jgi:hypothetical protein
MKTPLVVCVLILVLGTVIPAFAGDTVLPSNADKALIEGNLLKGLNSDNEGLRQSCALMLGNIKSTRAVIPLMSILRNSDNFKLKTAAAWALCNIGDSRGTFAVKREVEFNDCCKTQLVCAWYYEHMVHPGSFVFRDVEQALIADLTRQP